MWYRVVKNDSKTFFFVFFLRCIVFDFFKLKILVFFKKASQVAIMKVEHCVFFCCIW